jgi:PIN domain nuclease of toxin-antitoxin system
VRLLLDTHLVLWWEAGSPKLPSALPVLVNEADTVYISRASLWEVVIKNSLGRLELDLGKFTANVEAHGFRWLDISNAHLLAVATLPLLDDHKDPFDRLLVAQSRSEPLLFLTVDRKLERYGDTVRVL